MKLKERVSGIIKEIKEQIVTTANKKIGTDLGVKRLSQFDIKLPKDQHNEYCLFTSIVMAASVSMEGKPDLEKIKSQCESLGHIRVSDGFVFNPAGIAQVCGVTAGKWSSASPDAELMAAAIEARKALIINIQVHFECVDSYVREDDGSVTFGIKDPGYFIDTFVNSKDWTPYRLVKGKKDINHPKVKSFSYFK